MSFSTEQVAALAGDLHRGNVKTREQSGRKFSYIEGWLAEAEANRIFGYHAWDSETLDLRVVAEKPRKIGASGAEGFGVSYIAKVRVTVTTPEGHKVVREGVGAGHGIDKDLGLAHESAAKEAETDAEKRCLKTFGNPFGLALYDKTQAHVSDGSQPPPENDRDEPNGRKRAAQAKRDGDDEKIKAEIAGLDMKGLADFNADFDRLTAHLPLSWLDPVRDMLESRFLEIGGTARVAEDDAAMNDAFRAAVGPASPPPVAGRNTQSRAAA